MNLNMIVGQVACRL